MRTLNGINVDFHEFKSDTNISKAKKIDKYVELMNELEKDYKTFIFSPKEDDLNTDEIRLYREISQERDK